MNAQFASRSEYAMHVAERQRIARDLWTAEVQRTYPHYSTGEINKLIDLALKLDEDGVYANFDALSDKLAGMIAILDSMTSEQRTAVFEFVSSL